MNKMSQMDVANGIGLSQNMISAIERGARMPGYDTLQKLSKFFGVPMSSLVLDEEQDMNQEVTISSKRKLLFDRTKNFTDADMNLVLSVVDAIAKERDRDE